MTAQGMISQSRDYAGKSAGQVDTNHDKGHDLRETVIEMLSLADCVGYVLIGSRKSRVLRRARSVSLMNS
jgi:hypothetical protein